MTHIPGTFAAGHPEMTYFEHMATDPPRMKRFFRSMEEVERYLPTKGLYDFRWLVKKAEAEPERTVLVDVGCGKGHSTAATLQDYRSLPPERCVLEDRAEVIEAIEGVNDPSLSAVRKIAIDFHVEQPVKGTAHVERSHQYASTTRLLTMS